ncbi:MAG: hypothetical protein H8E44_32405 [Planctomycetes bacterium]|nr:hypothetical protein [Planctomycetota bacterium]MBL7037359.1 hypothetical protein [Pirellulaceae bacterium]
MDDQPQSDDPKRREEDTEAILHRRRFLIQSTLASAGLGAVVSGCQPQACLSAAPDPCLSVAPEPEPQPCLDVGPPEPQPCLEVEPPRPQPCLSEPPAPEPRPEPCLKVVEPPQPPPKPEPTVCLSIREGD